jgi:hypothetical protein
LERGISRDDVRLAGVDSNTADEVRRHTAGSDGRMKQAVVAEWDGKARQGEDVRSRGSLSQAAASPGRSPCARSLACDVGASPWGCRRGHKCIEW